MITCKDLVDLLSAYVDGELDGTTARRLEEHLRDCRECEAFLNTFRKTRALAREAAEATMPPELRARLQRFFRET